MKCHIRNITLTFLTIIALNSCQKEKLNGLVTENESLLAEIYSKSQDTINIDGLTITLLMDVYYAFTPGSIPVGKRADRRITAHASLLEVDSLTIGDTFEIDNLYIVKSKDIWISKPAIDGNQYDDFRLNVTSMNGPEWEPGIVFDAFVELVNKNSLERHILISRNQLIYSVK
jgi:hypothetical protein